jgi:uncharacterized RDD family membrane protein YckC
MSENTLQGQYAGVVTRGIAVFIDLGILSISLFVFNQVFLLGLEFLGVPTDCTTPEASGLYYWACFGATWIRLGVTALLAPLYYLFFWTLGGQTPGKALMGVRIVRLDGNAMTFGRSLRRLIGYAVCIATVGLGFLWAVIDDKRQGWDDKIAGTCVVYSWEARQNQDLLARVRKRLGIASPSVQVNK